MLRNTTDYNLVIRWNPYKPKYEKAKLSNLLHSGQLTAEEFTKELGNGAIAYFIDFSVNHGKIDEDLLREFQKNFEGWTAAHFAKLNHNSRQDVRDFLCSHGVYIPRPHNGRTYYELPKLLEKDYAYHEWNKDEVTQQLKKCKTLKIPFNSKAIQLVNAKKPAEKSKPIHQDSFEEEEDEKETRATPEQGGKGFNTHDTPGRTPHNRRRKGLKGDQYGEDQDVKRVKTIQKSSSSTFTRPTYTVPSKLNDQMKPTFCWEDFSKPMYRNSWDTAWINDSNLTGLSDIANHGTEQFSENLLDDILKRNKTEHWVVIDGRQEFHGFINGTPVGWWASDNHNWGNVDKPSEHILPKEQKKFLKLVERNSGNLAHAIPSRRENKKFDETKTLKWEKVLVVPDLSAARVETEQQLVERKGGKYIRCPIPDHARPSDAAIDELILNLRELGKKDDTSIIFHCHGGKGRTTLMMSINDMLHNAHQVSCLDIVKRQNKLRKLTDSEAPKEEEKDYKSGLAQEKTLFLEMFHLYARENGLGNDNAITWCEWLESKEVKV